MVTAETTLPMEMQIPENISSMETKRELPYDEDYEMALFRRVRIKTLIELPAPPAPFDSQNQSNIQQTSSYWSVPEQVDSPVLLRLFPALLQRFPTLLRRFGTDWHGTPNFMTTKTHLMVYTTVFQQWLTVSSDSNKIRRVANI